MPGVPPSWHRDLLALCYWAGEGSAASHRAAARLWGLVGFSAAKLEISTTANRLHGRRLASTVHRVDEWLIPEIVTVQGIPTTSPRRTLLDLAGLKNPRTERAVDEALHKDIVTLGQIWRLYEEEWTRGRRGIAILRSILIERTPGRAPTQSELENLFWDFLRERALPLPKRQFFVRALGHAFHVDFAYPPALLIEVDGYAWHSDRAAFDEDRRRTNLCVAAGYRVLRFTWAQIKWEPDLVEQVLRKELARPHTS